VVEEAAQDILVIPDLHGRLDALEAILRVGGFVDAQGALVDSGLWLVQLGDLLDRGPRPRACVERMMDLRARAPERVRVLKGNHEDMVLSADLDPAMRRLWLTNGGTSTLADYEGGFEALIEPGGLHYRWLESLPTHFEYRNVLFCHAGLGSRAKDGSTIRAFCGTGRPLSGGHTGPWCAATPPRPAAAWRRIAGSGAATSAWAMERKRACGPLS